MNAEDTETTSGGGIRKHRDHAGAVIGGIAEAITPIDSSGEIAGRRVGICRGELE